MPVAVNVPGDVPEQIGEVPPLILAVKIPSTVIVVVDVLTVPHVPLVIAQ
jgi:hypothetical protein